MKLKCLRNVFDEIVEKIEEGRKIPEQRKFQLKKEKKRKTKAARIKGKTFSGIKNQLYSLYDEMFKNKQNVYKQNVDRIDTTSLHLQELREK